MLSRACSPTATRTTTPGSGGTWATSWPLRSSSRYRAARRIWIWRRSSSTQGPRRLRRRRIISSIASYVWILLPMIARCSWSSSSLSLTEIQSRPATPRPRPLCARCCILFLSTPEYQLA